MLTLTEVADTPAVLTSRLTLDDGADVVFRPLVHADAEGLAGFLGGSVGGDEADESVRRVRPRGGGGVV